MNLPPEIVRQWEAYLAEEKDGVRFKALILLDAFIASLLAQHESVWQTWAIALSEEVMNHQRRIPVRMPLFRFVIFPALHSWLIGGSGAAARLLAGFSQSLYNSHHCLNQLPRELQTEYGLLLEAIKRDSSDLRSKCRLRPIFRNRFHYVLHELPSGVLFGWDAATDEECCELLEKLAQYSKLCEEIGWEDYDRVLIADASFYIHAYRDYLIHEEAYASFADYIEAHGRNKEQTSPTRTISTDQ